MTEYVLPILFSLFVWWFSTGAIIFLDGLPQKTFRWSLAGATIVFAGSLWGLAATAQETTLTAAYLAFTFGLLAWGWQEISFYMGYVTGPRRAPCPEDCRGFRHFLHAVQTSLWHELAIIAAAIAVWGLTRGEPNQIGFWTFIVLWWMHQSAKLNVFFGVRNLNEEFLPEHLTFLKSFLRRRPMNLLFPVSITVSTVIAAILFERAGSASTAFARVGDTMLGTLMALAILEHWFLVLPLPAGKLWQWGLASRKPTQEFDIEIVAGFLGAGKTTFMRRRLAMLAEAPEDRRGRTIALVNDFSSVGIDGSLLSGQGADVVELPNGCICCSLRNDLARQLEDVVARYAPDRVLIEPSGVADLASLVGVLERPEIAKLRRSLSIVTMIDAGAFLADFAAMQSHFEAQARLASLIVLNKTDLVADAERAAVHETLRRLNPAVTIVEAVYGAVPDSALTAALTGAPTITQADDSHAHNDHSHDHTNAHDHAAGHAHHPHEDHDHHHDHDHGAEALGFGSWNTVLAPHCDAEALAKVLDAAVAGHFGQVARLKGLARVGKGWIQFDVAGGKQSMTAFAANGEETARVVAIGNALDIAGLDAAFAGCALGLAA